MTKKIMLCFTSLGAGITMLANISVGIAAGNAISAAIAGTARQPEIANVIQTELLLILSKIKILLIVSFITALILLLLSIIFCMMNAKENQVIGFSSTVGVGICAAVGAGIAILGSSGMVIGIGQAGASLVENIARNPSTANLLTNLFKKSLPILLYGIGACAIIALGIILIMINMQCRWRNTRTFPL